MKEKYERTEIDIIEFLTEDVIMTSGPDDYDDYDDPDDKYMAPIR